MRHGKKFNHLGRQTAHRKAMFANMACSLIEHKRINTTVAKAKALRQFVEPLITKSKDDTTHNRRVVFAYLRNKYAVTELFKEVSVKVADRPGGYVRIIKLGNRQGDNAPMAMVELVDYNTTYNPNSKKKKKTTETDQLPPPAPQSNTNDRIRLPDKEDASSLLESAAFENVPMNHGSIEDSVKGLQYSINQTSIAAERAAEQLE